MISIAELIKKSNGKISKVKFKKRTTGEITTRRIRLGVSKYITGKGQKYRPEDYDLITVFDMDKSNYINIPLDAVLEFKCGQIEWISNV